MRVSRSCRVWSSSDRTTTFASSACGRTGQPSTVRRWQVMMPRRHGIHCGLPAVDERTYAHDNSPAEAGTPVEPVIVLQLVYLDALAIVGRWRYQCHNSSEGLRALRPGQTRPPECSARSRCLAQGVWVAGGGCGRLAGCLDGMRALADDDRIGGWAGGGDRFPQREVRARATAPDAQCWKMQLLQVET
jgi:hypothetical protein